MVLITMQLHAAKTDSLNNKTYPQRKPAPRAALFSLCTATLASFSVSRSTAAFSASKSAPLTGNIPVTTAVFLENHISWMLCIVSGLRSHLFISLSQLFLLLLLLLLLPLVLPNVGASLHNLQQHFHLFCQQSCC